MAKMEIGKFETKERERGLKDLWQAIETMVKQGDLIVFLEHLFTESEQMMFARRIQIAKFLLQGETHRFISRKLRVGIATIQKVDQWLATYKEYRKVLPPLYHERTKSRKKYVPDTPYTFRWLRHKYPLHFLLFNLMLDEWNDKK